MPFLSRSLTVIIIIIITQTIACKTKKDHFSNCTIPYTVSTLFKNYDSSRFDILKVGSWTRIWDKGKMHGNDKDKGFYSFDQNNILRLYVFLVDDSSFQFGIKFDSLGQEINKPHSNIVRWIIQNKGSDSSRITFLVFQINRSYGTIKLSTNHDTTRIILYESRYYSNLAASEITVNNHSHGLIRLSGRMRDDCTGEIENLEDSINVANELGK